MPHQPTVHSFIDRGDFSSDAGAPSSIDQYSLDSFLVPDESDDDQGPHQRLLRRGTSPLFEPLHSRRGSSHGSNDGSLRHRRLPSSGGSTSSHTLSWLQRQRRRESSHGSFASFGSGSSEVPLRTASSMRRVRNLDELRRTSVGPENPREDTPDPFKIPDHIRADEAKGLSVPGKRLGSGKFRVSCRYLLLTYAQCGPDWPHQALVDLCGVLDAKYHISRELHDDGGTHFHAFLDFNRKFETENVHRYCIGVKPVGKNSRCPGLAHCNILPVPRTPFNMWDYVSKYGDVVASNLDRPVARGPNTTRDDLWCSSLALPDKNSFLADAEKHSPREFIIFHRNIKYFADERYGVTKKEPRLPNYTEKGIYVNWKTYPEARKWVLESLHDPIPRIKALARGDSYPDWQEAEDRALLETKKWPPQRPRSLIVYGSTKLGKSDFARNLGPHISWRRDFDLGNLIDIGAENIDYAIFDDIDWSNGALKGDGYKAWLGGQDDFTCTDKYKGKFTVSWGKPCIFLTNNDPFKGLRPADANWLLGNCFMVDVGEKFPDHRNNAISSGDCYDNE
ncbi:MAG: Rep catalytic domain protein [Cressdnaviricota sp.]|nr:MAG: Rep catalytic domain protein [Cressdnaviricota sp.]